jgi:hypothetical protein
MSAHILLQLFLAIYLTFPATAFAGPPFLTDDPVPVPFKNWEAYLFGTVDAARQVTSGTGPAMEFNVGAIPNLQIHLVVPLAFNIPKGEAGTYGKGDMEFGLKYRFIQESDYLPMVAAFPLLEIPTGEMTRGLSNGRGGSSLSGCRRVGDPGQPMVEVVIISIPPRNSGITILAVGWSNVISVRN